MKDNDSYMATAPNGESPRIDRESARVEESQYIATGGVEPIRVDSIPEHHFALGKPWSPTEYQAAVEPFVPNPAHDSLFLKFEQLDDILYKLEQGEGARHSRARQARQLLDLIRKDVLK